MEDGGLHGGQPCVSRCDGQRLRRAASTAPMSAKRYICGCWRRGLTVASGARCRRGRTQGHQRCRPPATNSRRPRPPRRVQGRVRASAMPTEKPPAKLPPVELNGFPVRYGDEVTGAAYEDQIPRQSRSTRVRMARSSRSASASPATRWRSDGLHPRRMLLRTRQETPRDGSGKPRPARNRRRPANCSPRRSPPIGTTSCKAHAEYLLGNLAQEYADLAKNEEAKLPMYQDALARFSKIPTDYPDTEFAPRRSSRPRWFMRKWARPKTRSRNT